jgi:hypothetical protein
VTLTYTRQLRDLDMPMSADDLRAKLGWNIVLPRHLLF